MLLSIVFSFRNEEGNIAELVERVKKTIDELKDKNLQRGFS